MTRMRRSTSRRRHGHLRVSGELQAHGGDRGGEALQEEARPDVRPQDRERGVVLDHETEGIPSMEIFTKQLVESYGLGIGCMGIVEGGVRKPGCP